MTSRGGPAAPARPFSQGDATFGDELRLAGYGEAVEHAQIVGYSQALEVNALYHLSALQQIAGLATWPQPYVAPAPAARVAAPPRPPAPRPAPITDASFAASVLELLNARRAAAGLPAVRFDSRIALASATYAQRMSATGSFGHSIDGSTLTSRLAAAGFTEPVVLGEIIAWSSGSPSPATFVQLWMDSPSHREQMLSANYSRAGAGCAFGGGRVYCVVDFAG